MKRIVFLKPAVAALQKHRNVAGRLRDKIAGYAADPTSLANSVTELRGSSLKRLRVGDYRILSEETDAEIIVSKIGPRRVGIRLRECEMTATFITTPGGEELAILPASEYEDLRDALDHATALSDYRAGRDEGLSLEEVDALLAAATPLAFWRAKRSLTQAALAKAAETTQPHIADLESGKHGGSLEIMARIAKALRIKVDDLVTES